MNYGPQNQGLGNCGTTKGVGKIVEESDLVLQSQHFLTIVIASTYVLALSGKFLFLLRNSHTSYILCLPVVYLCLKLVLVPLK